MPVLQLTGAHVRDLVEQARTHQPHEACGLLSGRGRQVTRVHPIANVADAPHVRYQLAPIPCLRVLKAIDAHNEQLLAVYHTHPASDPLPSTADIRAATRHMPHIPQVIISLRGTRPRLSAWAIADGRVEPVEIVLHPDTAHHSQQALTRAQQIAMSIAILLAMVLLLAIAITLLPPAPPIAD
jgi:proteasome lid subunit RPN8/RPN11